MKKLFYILTMSVFSVTITFAQVEKPEEAFTQVDKLPKYPGGESAMNDFISKNLKYPREARQRNIQGKVLIKLIIEKDGSISETSIVESLGQTCDQEVTRAVKAMPKWIPGRKGNELVRSSLVLPVMFSLEGKSSK